MAAEPHEHGTYEDVLSVIFALAFLWGAVTVVTVDPAVYLAYLEGRVTFASLPPQFHIAGVLSLLAIAGSVPFVVDGWRGGETDG